MRKLLLIPLLLSAGACGGDGGTGSNRGGTLTADEAAELNRAVFGVAAALASSGGGFGVSLNSAPGPVTAENSITIPFEETQPCEPSGSVDVEGTATVSFDNLGQNTTIAADVSAAPDRCAHRMEDGRIITMTGDPDIEVELDATAGPAGLSALRVVESGAFTWARGDVSGRCTVDVTAQLNAATQMVAVAGTFCGFPISETFPIEG